MKRTFDIVVSLVGIVLFAPLLGVMALAILTTSGRPAVFKQLRVGKKGRMFVIRKFRTMSVLSGTETGVFEPGKRERITPFGGILRATKLDELPQLWNVLRGDMSMVGPRPEVPKWVAADPERWRKILSIKPGITDPASLVYRDEETILARAADPEAAYRETILPRKLDIYDAYICDQTLCRDIRVLAETLIRVCAHIPKTEG